MNKKEKLIEQIKKIDAQIKAIDNRERAKKRKEETRAKIIVGTLIFRDIKAGRYSDSDINLRYSLEHESTQPKDKEVLEEYLNELTAKIQKQQKPEQATRQQLDQKVPETPKKLQKKQQQEKKSKVLVNQKLNLIQTHYNPVTLYQMRLLLLIFAEVNKNNKFSYEQEFTMKMSELEKLTKKPIKISYKNLINAGEEIEKMKITIKKYRKTPLLTKINIVEYCNYILGKAEIKTKFTPEIIPYIHEISSCLTKQRIEYVMKMKSRYGIKLYDFFLRWLNSNVKCEFRPNEFKETLGLENKYKVIKDLRRNVIIPALDDINKYSDLTVIFKQHKIEQRVSHFQFTIQSKNN